MDLQPDYDYQSLRRSKVPYTKQNRFSVFIREPSTQSEAAQGSKKAMTPRKENRVWKNKKEDSCPLDSSYFSTPMEKYSNERTEDLQAWEFITMDDTSFDFTVNDSYDAPPYGGSSTQSQANGSKKTRMRRIGSRARKKRRSRKKSYESNSASTNSSNNNLRQLFKMGITIIMSTFPSIMNNFIDSIIENTRFNIVNWFTSIQSMVFDVCTSLGVLSFWIFRPLYHSSERTITETKLNMNRAHMKKASSWIIVLTFPWCLLMSNYKHSLLNEQRSLSLWLALFGMFNFIVFLSSLFLMVISEAHFTRMQITVLLISAMVMNTYITGSRIPTDVPMQGILFAGSFAGA